MLDQINEVFFEEARELLESLEGHLLSLEENPDNKEIISAVFRIMHTIKGSSGMFGFDSISKFTHEVENTFDAVRNGAAQVTPDLIRLTLRSRDHILDMLDGSDTEETKAESEAIISELKKILSPEKEPQESIGVVIPQKKEEVTEESSKKEEVSKTWRISFTPSVSILCNGTRPSLMIKELTEFGTATVIMFSKNIPPLSQIEPTSCYLSWDIILTTTHSKEELLDVFIFLDETSIVKIEEINIDEAYNHKIGEILLNRKSLTPEALEDILDEQKPIGQMLVEKNIISSENLQSALAEQNHIKKVAKAKSSDSPSNNNAANHSSSIRVTSEKLDLLINLVGEMVTFNARLDQISKKLNNPALITLSEQSERYILSLRDTAMDMRMLPIGTTFTRFRRLVHDLAADLHKNIELVTEGAETEIDKTVIEKLNDPLIHMIRNSVDHGIESPEERVAKGKSPQGTIKLTARHAGAFVLIIISDDGAGLNKEKIYAKALEKGLVPPGTNPSDSEIYDMIFLPGFSTADTVSSVSGRGVGMDVVKKDIAALSGSVSIESRPGNGTDFILKIPLTLAIIEGMMVQIGSGMYIIPLANIVECIEFSPENEDDEDRVCSHINARGEFLPYINLRKWFEIDEPQSGPQQVVIVNDQDSKVGLVVDKVIGNHQTVIKPLGDLYRSIEGLSGATILGDSSVALILDVFKLSNVIRKTQVM